MFNNSSDSDRQLREKEGFINNIYIESYVPPFLVSFTAFSRAIGPKQPIDCMPIMCMAKEEKEEKIRGRGDLKCIVVYRFLQ